MRKNATRAVERMSLMSEGVGGALIGALHQRRQGFEFAQHHDLSDGYDTGTPEALAREK
jgi:hypothetical protein